MNGSGSSNSKPPEWDDKTSLSKLPPLKSHSKLLLLVMLRKLPNIIIVSHNKLSLEKVLFFLVQRRQLSAPSCPTFRLKDLLIQLAVSTFPFFLLPVSSAFRLIYLSCFVHFFTVPLSSFPRHHKNFRQFFPSLTLHGKLCHHASRECRLCSPSVPVWQSRNFDLCARCVDVCLVPSRHRAPHAIHVSFVCSAVVFIPEDNFYFFPSFSNMYLEIVTRTRNWGEREEKLKENSSPSSSDVSTLEWKKYLRVGTTSNEYEKRKKERKSFAKKKTLFYHSIPLSILLHHKSE